MSHNVETMAWTGETPWHGLGIKVEGDLSAQEMMAAAGLDWQVDLADEFTHYPDGTQLATGNKTLYRTSDRQFLDTVGEDWFPVQNEEAFNFFEEYTKAGQMTMETAGSLQNGKIVWALAKVQNSFEAVRGDVINAYMLLTSYHKYGFSTDERFTAVRVVCNNTLTAALRNAVGKAAKQSHRRAFDPSQVKQDLGLVHKKMAEYNEAAVFLASKLYNEELVTEFFNQVFPVIKAEKTEGKRKTKDTSSNAQAAALALQYQPGVEFAPGSWWQAFNATTYVTNHLQGRTDDARVSSLWYGANKDVNHKALDLAVDFAKLV